MAGHPLVDAGAVIAGINDAGTSGAGPDVGAFERGGRTPGPQPESGDVLRSDLPRELPGTPDARFRNVRLPWTDPDSVLTSPALPRLLCYVLEPGAGRIGVEKSGDTVLLALRP